MGRLRRFGRGPVNVGSWHVRDVTPAATRAAAIKGGAAIPARSPFMLRPRCRTLRALSFSDPNVPCRDRVDWGFRTGLMHTKMNPISRLLVIPAKARIQSPSAQAVSPCSSQGQALDPAFAG